MKYSSIPQQTLAQSLIAEGLIQNPLLIKAVGVQQELIGKTGAYRLLGSIIFEIKAFEPGRMTLRELLGQMETYQEPASQVSRTNLLDLTDLFETNDLLDLSELFQEARQLVAA